MIMMKDEFSDTFFIISNGRVKITRVSEDGREVILAMLGEGEFFGEMSLLDEETRSAKGIALEDTEVLSLKRPVLMALLEEYPKIAISLLAELARRIRKRYEMIVNLSLSDAEHRVAKTVVRLAEEFAIILKGVVEIKSLPCRQDIAKMAGVSRETVSRTLKLFEREGLIRCHGRGLSVLDYNHFKRMFS